MTLIEIMQASGFSQSQSKICDTLFQLGPQIISQIASSSGVERTRVYRDIIELIDLDIVELGEAKNSYKFKGLLNLSTVIDTKSKDLISAKDSIEELLNPAKKSLWQDQTGMEIITDNSAISRFLLDNIVYEQLVLIGNPPLDDIFNSDESKTFLTKLNTKKIKVIIYAKSDDKILTEAINRHFISTDDIDFSAIYFKNELLIFQKINHRLGVIRLSSPRIHQLITSEDFTKIFQENVIIR